jgi:hypothetical protein
MRNSLVHPDDFLANDIYELWVDYCQKARSSITIISPYVDATVVDLLLSEGVDDSVQKQVYTRVDSDTIFDKPYQVKALIHCVEKGIEIFHISELHAKVLVIDEKYISLGSQNFTRRGRKNKETSILSSLDFTHSKFYSNLSQWMSDSIQIEIEYLRALEQNLVNFGERISSLREEHRVKFDEVSLNQNSPNSNEFLNLIMAYYRDPTVKFASKYAYLELEFIPSGKGERAVFRPEEKNVDLTRLVQPNSDDETHLTRLNYVPAINIGNSSMAFVRLGIGVISFCTFSRDFRFSCSLYEDDLGCIVTLPRKNTTHVNFVIHIYWPVSATLNFYFDGMNFLLREPQFDNAKVEETITFGLLEDQEELTRLINSCLTKYPTREIHKHQRYEIDEYLEGSHYIFGLSKYQDAPILAFK